MHVQIKKLRYWKTEHKDLDRCQDSYSLDPSRGLFVVADGAGTTLFPAIWARILADHFVNIPLMSNHPFEVEWWVRLAQDEYKTRIPDAAHLLDWSLQQKAQNQSSDSTLATVRISALEASTAQAELLVFGDSCVIIGNTVTQEVESFVLQNPADFAQAPICIPSSLKFFNRYFHTCSLKSVTLGPEHIVILASDAVSKWILSGGGGHYTGDTRTWEAFQTVCSLSEETWPGFIDASRDAKEMVNDDSTALILMLKEDSTGDGVPLGSTTRHDDSIIQQREAAFDKARQEQNSELVAIYYGDGKDLQLLVSDMTDEEITHARKVADALKEVLRAFRQAQNNPGLVAKMQPVWRQYGPVLQNEKCAENIRETLRSNGVNLSFSDPEPPQQPQQVPLSASGSYGTPPDQKALAAKQAEQEKRDLELTFLKVYSGYTAINEENKKDNYEALLAAADALDAARARYPDIYQYTVPQEEHIALARSHKQAMENLRKALSEGRIEQIEAVYDPALISEKRLTPDQLMQIRLACQLAAAYRSDDDEMILAANDEISRSGNQKFFKLTPQEHARIDLAQRRRAALNTFQVFLQAGHLRQIAKNYNPILDQSKKLTESERELLQLAKAFADAYDADDDEALVAVYQKIKQSSHYDHIAFIEAERRRIEQAKSSVKAMQVLNTTVVAKVKDQSITLGQVRKVCIVRKVIANFWIERYQREIKESIDEASKQEKIQQIAETKDYIASRNIAGKALEELLNDIFIREEMDDVNVQNAFLDEFEGKQKMLSRLEYFQTSMIPDYPAFLKNNKLSYSDMEETVLIFSRYEFFSSNFENLQPKIQPKFRLGFKPKTIRDWLDKQRKEVIYMHSSNFEQRSLWLAEQLGWKE